MRFRIADVSDASACVDLLRLDGSFRPAAKVAAVWCSLFVELVASDRASLVVWEDVVRSSFELIGFGLTAFVHPELLHEYERSPRPWFTNLVYRRLLESRPAVLAPDEVRERNGSGGLHLATLHFALKHRSLSHPVNQRYLPVGASSYYFMHSGYRLESAWFEVCGAELGEYLQSGGFSLWREFADHPDARGCDPDRAPRMFNMTRAASLAQGFSPATASLFNAPHPRFGFAPAEQRVLLRALLGETNREIAAGLGLSVQTVNKAWESAIRRIEMISPCLLAAQDCDGKRGGEKRRHVLDYLRYHMEELRPYRASAAAHRPEAGSAR